MVLLRNSSRAIRCNKIGKNGAGVRLVLIKRGKSPELVNPNAGDLHSADAS